jgi:hypothetical protein
MAVRRIGLSLRTACLLLLTVIGVVYLVVAPLAEQRFGAFAWQSAGLAAAITGFGALAALVVGSVFRDPRSSVASVFGGMILRMGIPLAAGIYIQSRGGRLAESGFFSLVLIFYLVCLVAETLLALGVNRSRSLNDEATDG